MHISPVKNRPHQSVRSSWVKCLAMSLSFLLALPVHAETITYQHDNNGNITQRGTTTFAYDALNRLIGEAGPAKTQTITYDENGNRKSDGAGSYTYETGSNRMLTRRGLSVTTDSLGNITADGTGRTYTRNQANQLYQVFQNGILLATYYYDGNGRRTRKVTTASAPQGAQTIFYGYDDEGHLIAELSGTNAPLRTYVWQDDAPLAQIEYQPSRKIYYFNVDHLNTPRSLMDDTGKMVWRWESDAFGSTLPNEDVDGDGVKITSNLRFPGQYYDKETGLHYNWHRYYDPTMGQYIEPDPLGLAAGINLYQYSNSNPISNVDPYGLASCTYSVSSHTLSCTSNSGGDPVTLGPKGVWSGNQTTGCANNSNCSDIPDVGPIIPGDYTMNRDDRPKHEGFWRLEPNPKVPGWKCRLGIERCGFELHPGGRSAGCITADKRNQDVMKQYKKINELLNNENGKNRLKVVP